MKKTENDHLKFAVLAVDVVLFTIENGKLLVRLSKVDRPPYFHNASGFPGGLVHQDETAEETAIRIIRDKAHIDPAHIHIEQLFTFSAVDRDPRGRVVSVGYIAFVPWEQLTPGEQSNTEEVWWSEKKALKNLAYDHSDMFKKALTHLHHLIKSTTVIFKLLPRQFTLTTLEKTFEIVLGETIDKRNFRKKIKKLDILKGLKEKTSGVNHRPAELYTPKSTSVQEISIL